MLLHNLSLRLGVWLSICIPNRTRVSGV